MVVKKRVKRNNVKKISKRPALSSAIRDLEQEIKKLSKEKAELKRSSGKTSTSIESSREQQKLLQQKIAKLLEQEAKLNKRKKNLQVKIDRDADKINKISKIRSEISDI